MRRGYTLIEIIITIAITGILAIGMFKALQAITLRSEKAKALSNLSLDSQSALDQIAALLYDRAPMFLEGCDSSGNCEAVEGIEHNKTMLTWYGLASESYQNKNYSGFVDMSRSNKSTNTLYSPDTNLTAVLKTQQDKWGDSFALSDMILIFSGSFDEGIRNKYNITDNGVNTITLNGTPPDVIYEKYSLVDSAYAVTRNEHAKLACTKPTDLVFTTLKNFKNDDLLLFYNYRPWKGETFCDGAVAVLASDTSAFRAQMLNGTIRLGLDMKRSIRGSSDPVHLSKQKVVF